MNDLRNGLYGTAFVLAAAALGGCGQVANVRSLSTGYVPPQGGETARIRLLTDGLVRAVPGRDSTRLITSSPNFARVEGCA